MCWDAAHSVQRLERQLSLGGSLGEPCNNSKREDRRVLLGCATTLRALDDRSNDLLRAPRCEKIANALRVLELELLFGRVVAAAVGAEHEKTSQARHVIDCEDK